MHTLKRKATSDGHSYNCAGVTMGMEKTQKKLFQAKASCMAFKSSITDISGIPFICIKMHVSGAIRQYNSRLRPNCKES